MSRFNPNTPEGQQKLNEAFVMWINTEMTLDKLAESVGISRSQLSKRFSMRLRAKRISEPKKNEYSHY